MTTCTRFFGARPFALATVLLSAVLLADHHAQAGGSGFFRSRAVGGVIVDGEGVLVAAEPTEIAELRQMRIDFLKRLPADINTGAELRKVSLRRIEETLRERQQKAQVPLVTEEMSYLAGLTRIKYVLVYPEDHDIVLVGPAEKMVVDELGHMVGAESGKPILQLDHLLVALRTAESAARNPITCSIDPTKEGIARLQTFLRTQKSFTPAMVRGVEEAMGPQQITITGVSPQSDFARTLVAADYRMKRLAMQLDNSGIKGLPSYLQMMKSTTAGLQSVTPRWWLAPNYEPLHKDPEGLAWELRGQGVKVMTEDSLIAETGVKTTGNASPAAQAWADAMTNHYDELCVKYPIFGELRNVMDMAVVGALIVKEDLCQKAGFEMTMLKNSSALTVEEFFAAPQTVDTKASAVRRNRKVIVSASGGVEVSSWQVLERTEVSDDMAPIRKDLPAGNRWWWN